MTMGLIAHHRVNRGLFFHKIRLFGGGEGGSQSSLSEERQKQCSIFGIETNST